MAYDKANVDKFLATLIKDSRQSHAHLAEIPVNINTILDFYVLIKRTTLRSASTEVMELLSKFQRLSDWERANVLFALVDVIKRDVTDTACKFAEIARSTD